MEVEQTTAIRYICFFLYNLFAHLANLYYLCCEKPKTGRAKVLKPAPSPFYLMRFIIMRISSERKTTAKTTFFIVFRFFLLLLCSRCGAAFRFSDGTTIPPAPFCTKTPLC